MCVIVDIPAGVDLAESVLSRCFYDNNHGWGIMWSQDGELYAEKNVTSFNSFMDTYERVPSSVRRAVHFRIKTHGLIDVDNCHPFTVLSKDQDGMSLGLMHNGIIDTEIKNQDRSDTWNFVEHELTPFLRDCPQALSHQTFLNMLQSIASPSRIFMMDNDGMRYYFGTWHDALGCKFSNLASTYETKGLNSFGNYGYHQSTQVWCPKKKKLVNRHKGITQEYFLGDHEYEDEDGFWHNGQYRLWKEFSNGQPIVDLKTSNAPDTKELVAKETAPVLVTPSPALLPSPDRTEISACGIDQEDDLLDEFDLLREEMAFMNESEIFNKVAELCLDPEKMTDFIIHII